MAKSINIAKKGFFKPDSGGLSISSLRACGLRVVSEKDGSMLVETAIVLTTFFLLLFGIFEFSMVLASYCNATYAVRVASRYASVHSASSIAPASTANVQSLVQSSMYMPGATSSVITVNYTTTGSNPGNIVGNTVNVSMSWHQAISLPGYQSNLSIGTQTHRVISR